MYHSANDTFSIPCNCISDLKCGDEMLQFFIPSASCVCSFCANHLSALYPEESSTGDSPVFGNGQKGQVHSIFIQAGTVKGITPHALSCGERARAPPRKRVHQCAGNGFEPGTNGLQLFVFRQLDRARNEFCAGLAAELEMRAAAPHIALAGTGRPASCLDARHGLRRRVAVGLE